MGVLNENVILGSSAVSGGFEIEQSLRFNNDDSPNLDRGSFSPTSPHTVSVWVKRGDLGRRNVVWAINAADTLEFTSDDYLSWQRRPTTMTTTQRFRDTTNWYHIVCKSESGAIYLYVNNVVVASNTSSTANPYTAGDIHIGSNSPNSYINSSTSFDGYLAEFHWIDGTALGPDSFGEADEDYGHWKPIEYTGSHGTNGFYLDFASSSALGDDASGSNDFTVNNITASDQTTDTPTNNFAVMNNLNNQPFATTFAEGNLEITTGGSGEEPSNMATFGMRSGKWYFEVYQKSGSASGLIGIRSQQPGTISPNAKDSPGKSADGYAWYGYGYVGNLVNNDGYVTYGSTLVAYGNGDVLSVAVDLDNNKCYWAKNGTYIASGNPSSNSNGHSITAVGSTDSGEYFPCIGDYDANSYVFVTNFGQDGTFAGNITAGGNSDGEGIGNFKYSVPSGFKALCSKNLPDPACKPSENFNTVLYTGTGSSQTITTTIQPDMCWVKNRDRSGDPVLVDILRGAGQTLFPHSNGAEADNASGGAMTIGSSGFTVSGIDDWWNKSGDAFVSWNWKMNGTGSSNSNGSITATVSANTTAGQSIMIYSGASGNGTVGHGLSVAPNLVIVKTRSDADQWRVGTIQNSGGPPNFTDYFKLNASDGFTDESTTWNDTAPTSTVISVGSDSATNHPGYTHVAYCFHNVEGYSKIGQYEGTMDADGGFAYLGFRPAWVLIKAINSSQNWVIFDNKRDPSNPVNRFFHADTNDSEKNQDPMLDFLSNGMKMRRADSWHNNSYSDGYFYYAVAEQPFKFSNAR